MSDFDEEAERERLREKYEREQREREATQRMSELLLQGATMTNQHCDECGDPIFRYDGQKFCATCQGAAEGEAGQAEGDESVEDDSNTREGEARAQQARGDAGTTPDAVSEGNDASLDVEVQSDQPASGDRGQTAAGAGVDATRATSAGTEPTESESDRDDPARSRRQTGAGTDAGAATGVDEARRALSEAAVEHANAAAATDDPRRAREHLRAAREAAEALEALGR